MATTTFITEVAVGLVMNGVGVTGAATVGIGVTRATEVATGVTGGNVVVRVDWEMVGSGVAVGAGVSVGTEVAVGAEVVLGAGVVVGGSGVLVGATTVMHPRATTKTSTAPISTRDFSIVFLIVDILPDSPSRPPVSTLRSTP